MEINMINKTYAVFGLGRYGTAVARELSNSGADVLAVDIDESAVNTAATELPICKCADITDPEVPEHLKVTEQVIEELGAAGKPVIYVYNKCDRAEEHLDVADSDDTVLVSGITGEGVDRLLALIEKIIHSFKKKYTLLIPYSVQSVVSSLDNSYSVESVDYRDDGILVEVILDERGCGLYGKYSIGS
jgi:50S ribosomal subunit-associated GTPase HflX